MTPDFDGSPERFTSISAGTVSRCAADTEASECTSSQIPLTTLALFALEVPDEVPPKRVAVTACLRSRSWARFSPTTSTPASARTPMSSSATYFVAATKYVSVEDMAVLAEAGVEVVGENRAQDLERKHAATATRSAGTSSATCSRKAKVGQRDLRALPLARSESAAHG